MTRDESRSSEHPRSLRNLGPGFPRRRRLRRDFEQRHRAVTERVSQDPQGTPHFRARCSCTWVGTTQNTIRATRSEITTHLDQAWADYLR